MAGEMKIFGGRAHPSLVQEICDYLNLEPGRASALNFSDGEIFCQIDENVRGADVFVVQPTCPPVNDNLMELLIMLDAFKRSSASRITAVMPYYGYARQDRKDKPRVPITAKLVADLISARGRRPRPDDGPARRADPGLLQHPGRSPVRRAGDARSDPRDARSRRPGHRLAGRRRRGARAGLRQAPGGRPGHHRQAPHGAEREPRC